MSAGAAGPKEGSTPPMSRFYVPRFLVTRFLVSRRALSRGLFCRCPSHPRPSRLLRQGIVPGLLILALGLSACAQTSATLLPTSGNSPSAEAPPPAFAQFSDIPVPDKAVMDLDRTLLLGSENAWIGRLVYDAPFSPSGMFDFFAAEMPKFGWSQITIVRSETSVMTFRQSPRIATIQLDGTGTGGTTVSFTVSPEGSGNPVGGISRSSGAVSRVPLR